ncbi:helix-turn-helix transcriptional regulator [uncultured Victivallis sp.]|uniref:helix-turn-helix domain-containing protein n=1 Tax=uncultured Victivallis sp. TaxID=354118 RepID=UPI00338DB10B
MKVSYKKLWKLLIDRNMKKTDLRLQSGISSTSLAKLGKDENVSMDVLKKICKTLDCNIGDIMDILPDENKENTKKTLIAPSKRT